MSQAIEPFMAKAHTKSHYTGSQNDSRAHHPPSTQFRPHQPLTVQQRLGQDTHCPASLWCQWPFEFNKNIWNWKQKYLSNHSFHQALNTITLCQIKAKSLQVQTSSKKNTKFLFSIDFNRLLSYILVFDLVFFFTLFKVQESIGWHSSA